MTADFSAGGASYISMTAGAAAAVGTGDYTMAGLWKPNANSGVTAGWSGASIVRSLLNDTGHLYGHDDFSSGFGSMTSGLWYVGAETKPAGSNPYRMHLWPYAADGSGTMAHGLAASGVGNHADGAALTEIRIGLAETNPNAVIAVIAYWDRVLADAELDTLKSPNLSAWAALSPKALFSLQGWNGSTGCVDVVGTSTFNSLSGTCAVGTDPPSFNYALATPVKTGAFMEFF